MADVRTRVETVSNAGATIATLGGNFNKFVISQSDAGREFVISASKTGGFRDDDLLAISRQLTLGTATPPNDLNGPDAGTIAAFGTADGTFQKDADSGLYENAAGDTLAVLHFRVQNTGTPNLAIIDASTYRANDTNDITLATVVVFNPAL